MPGILAHIKLCCVCIVHSGFSLWYLPHTFLFVLHYVVKFAVFMPFFPGGQNFRLSSLVGGVWVVCFYSFLWTAVLVVFGLGRVVFSGFCVLSKMFSVVHCCVCVLQWVVVPPQ
jgi:hypothetical protein